jgi:UDPglucose 6-dehydrogenase
MGLAGYLAEAGVSVVAYDPAAMEEARKRLGEKVRFAASAAECCRQADVVVIAVGWSEFGKLGAEAFKKEGRRSTVIDCWRVLGGRDVGANVMVLGVGRGRKD